MTDWFEWNGVKCTAYGIHVSEHPPITAAKERTSSVSVPGMSGTLTVTEGKDVYEDVNLTVNCFIQDIKRIDEINAWLIGQSGTVRFANRPDGVYHARVSNQIAFDKILRGNPHRKFAITFKCKPFFELLDVPTITLTAPGSVNNPYRFSAAADFTVSGTGTVTLTVNGIDVTFSDLSRPVTLDGQALMAYARGNGELINKNSTVELVDDEWPTLAPGQNTIRWDVSEGTVSSVVINPHWRRL